MTHEERHLRPRSGVWIASTCVAAYFGLSLVPHALPGLGGTGLSFAYVLSLPIVVLLLLGGRGLGRCGSIARVGTRAPAQTAPPRVPLGRVRRARVVHSGPRLGTCRATAFANRIGP